MQNKNFKKLILMLSVMSAPLVVGDVIDDNIAKAEYKTDGLYYKNNKLANGWYVEGSEWYFFQNGKKHTGVGKDDSGSKYFVNGKYANGVYGGKTYREGTVLKTTETTKVDTKSSNQSNINSTTLLKNSTNFSKWEKNNIGQWYYKNADGTAVKNKWIGNYYLGNNGVMLTNTWTPDGYYVDATGKWVAEKGKKTETKIDTVKKDTNTDNKATTNKTGSASQGNYDVINKVIYLDAGHGGTDPGAVYNGVTEKALNLAVQHKVKAQLEAEGYKVVTTRTSDTGLGLVERSQKANATNADMFISIHFNASTNSAVSGIETYWYQSYNEYPPRINVEHHNNSDRLAMSKYLAEAIHGDTLSNSGAIDRGIQRNTFAVLRETTAPSVLVELGYMSNTAENTKIKQDAYQKKLADGIVSGILKYYKKFN